MLISMQSTQRGYERPYTARYKHTHTHTSRDEVVFDQCDWDLAKMIGIVQCAFILHHRLQNTRNKLPQLMAQKVANSSQALHRLKVCICGPVT